MEERNNLIKELFELHRLLADKGEIGIGYGFSENYNRLEKQVKKLTLTDVGCSFCEEIPKDSFYLGMTCGECNKPFRAVKNKQ